MFEIKDKFYLNSEPFQIISGAIHYFRTVPEYWRDRLEKLVNMGCNTVETYIPWNFHEPNRGEFLWEGSRDVCRFIETAKELGIYDRASVAVHLRGVGIWRAARMASQGQGDTAALLIQAVS